MRKRKGRFIYMIIVGIVVGLFLELIKPITVTNKQLFFHFLTSVVITILVWEGNLRIDFLMNKRFPWIQKPLRRILIHAPVSIVFSTLTIYGSMLLFDRYMCEIPKAGKDTLMIVSVSVGMLITFIILSMEIGTQFFGNWKRSLLEVEKYKAESLQAQLQNLKDQVNPHFLFNNLSVLSSLVYKDQDKSVDFINQLSKVYRYLLDNRNNELVTLENELTFIKSYTYLLQIRFDTNIAFDFQVPEDKLQLMLPPMALQMLIENAIKHNEVSSAFPLKIAIMVDQDILQVSNDLQLRKVEEESSRTGLQNIKKRYSYFTSRQVEVMQTEKQFVVRIPLLVSK
ncbi:MAG: histidine kinase [Bacteroidota bacterium]|nr:histidine kinase [Bacteroidota bacterium]